MSIVKEKVILNRRKLFSVQVYLLLLHFALLSFTDSAPFFQFESLWQSRIKQAYRCGFSKSIYSLPVSVWHLSHYLVNCHNISKILVFIIFLWWSVISDLCCHCSNCFEMSWSSSKYDGELHLRMLCSNCLSEWPSSISLPVLRPPYSLKCNSTEIRPIN